YSSLRHPPFSRQVSVVRRHLGSPLLPSPVHRGIWLSTEPGATIPSPLGSGLRLRGIGVSLRRGAPLQPLGHVTCHPVEISAEAPKEVNRSLRLPPASCCIESLAHRPFGGNQCRQYGTQARRVR